MFCFWEILCSLPKTILTLVSSLINSPNNFLSQSFHFSGLLLQHLLTLIFKRLSQIKLTSYRKINHKISFLPHFELNIQYPKHHQHIWFNKREWSVFSTHLVFYYLHPWLWFLAHCSFTISSTILLQYCFVISSLPDCIRYLRAFLRFFYLTISLFLN